MIPNQPGTEVDSVSNSFCHGFKREDSIIYSIYTVENMLKTQVLVAEVINADAIMLVAALLMSQENVFFLLSLEANRLVVPLKYDMNDDSLFTFSGWRPSLKNTIYSVFTRMDE